MNIISVNQDNIDKEHICCAISDIKGENCVSSKKSWMHNAFVDGLIFKKADVRGKVFIEYIPAEKAWDPIYAPNHLFINCFWVSGQYKGQGLANELLDECIADARRMKKDGLVVVSSGKKRAFLSDPGYLAHKGFNVVDEASPFFTLMQLKLNENAATPYFLPNCKEGKSSEKGCVLYFTNQCPFTEKYAHLLLDTAKQNNIDLKLIKLNSCQEAQSAPTPWTTYSLFVDGQFVTNEILTDKKFIKLVQEKRK